MLAHTSADFLPLIDPSDRLADLRGRLPGKIVLTTSFGIEDQAITHFIFSRGLEIEIATLDTGRLFPSTYTLWDQTEQKYGHRIRAFYPDAVAVSDMVADAGINGFYHSKEARLACCNARKVEPLNRALAGAEAWVTGLRSDQSGQRTAVPLEAWDADRNIVKFAPLFDWSRGEVADFCAVEGVPVNALHAEGFLSIGCQPCTRAVALGEPERAGRWWWEGQGDSECGLHVGADGKLFRGKAA
ncbi:MAG: phosphoadenylyl-sulfate reductase [Sphingomicrobium sp.]|nr:phosphoadenylyl-sulfate reductase [Sphingomonadales bacterium]